MVLNVASRPAMLVSSSWAASPSTQVVAVTAKEFSVAAWTEAMGKQEQTTMSYCIEGPSGVAKWGGVPMRAIGEQAEPNPEVKYAVFYSFADSLLAYEMNGETLSELHGSPFRLRCENELGFKNIKWVRAIEFASDFRNIGAGQGGYNEDVEFLRLSHAHLTPRMVGVKSPLCVRREKALVHCG
jgi:hypothetical protein